MSAPPPPTVLIVDDDPAVCHLLTRILRAAGYTTLTANDGAQALAAIDAGFAGVVLLDFGLPDLDGVSVFRRLRELGSRCPVVFVTGKASADLALETIREGAIDFVTKPFRPRRLLEAVAHAGEALGDSRPGGDGRGSFAGIVTASEPMLRLLRALARVLDSDASVLIEGESGTGQELLARALHHGGPRAGGPFVAVNCAGIPRDLLEAELFGHERGAFTGADRRRIGRFEAARGGTLFLDEIGEMPAQMQPTLLRVLEEGAVQRLGSNAAVPIDVRIIAATNRTLTDQVEAERFRGDLYFRLAVFSVRVPPLRERAGDVRLLTRHFVERLGAQLEKGPLDMTSEAMELLERYEFPGNVRELHNLLSYAALSCRGTTVGVGSLPPALLAALAARGGDLVPAAPPTGGWDELLSLRDAERTHIERVLRRAGGNHSEAARLLQISRQSLYRKLKSHGLGGVSG